MRNDAEHTIMPPGVRSIDHAADVGLDIDAPDLPALLDRAARGMVALLAGAEGAEAVATGADERDVGEADTVRSADSEPHRTERTERAESRAERTERAESRTERERRDITVDAADAAQLLADWLRELLYLYEVHGLEYAGAKFSELSETHMAADVVFRAAAESPVREIKGVTYHGLQAVRTPDGWRATVIFDV